MPSGEQLDALDQLLLQLASSAVRDAVNGSGTGVYLPAALKPALGAPGACFVTLKARGRLRGCIGNLEPRDSLAAMVRHNAAAAAMKDPRFPPVEALHLATLTIEVSVLQPAQALDVSSEQALLDTLVAGRDGLILSEGPRRATFLPSVWEQLPEAMDFVRQLKRKGGWSNDYWSADMKASIYQTRAIGPVPLLP
jgi:AmmeMemoRadiSam system protein A